MQHAALASVLVASIGLLAACKAGTTDGGGGSGGAATSSKSSTQTSTVAEGTGTQASTGNFSSSTGAATSGSGGACASVSAQADAKLQPADIVIAVDTSGSMDEEAAEVQANLNAFATIITNSGIDVHVVLIADSSVCIPAPLGSGQCGGADEMLPNYRHVVQGVASNDALQVILSTYPSWSGSLRPNATKTVAVVSDDDSNLSANDFTTQLFALEPTFMGFKFDAIVSSTSPDACTAQCFFNCAACTNPCCDKAMFCVPLSADEGKVYKQLVQQTGGVNGDLCTQNFDPVFQDMATGIVQDAQIACDYDLPPVPNGGTIDPDKVNVQFTPMGGAAMPILKAGNGVADCGPSGGWYYDDPVNPTKVVMCPSTCQSLQNQSGKLDVLFGCETVVVPPM